MAVPVKTLPEVNAGKRPPVVVKKYANRRLYNTESSSYIPLEDLADMVRAGRDFVVHDAKSGDDITRSVLIQIIVEEEGKGRNLLPTNSAKTRPSTRQIAASASQPATRPSAVPDSDHLLTWFRDFDVRLADLTARQHVLLKSLGVEPAPHREPAERPPSA